MGKDIIAQKRGSSPRYRSPSFKFKGAAKHLPSKYTKATIVELVHCLGHTAPLIAVKTDDNERHLMIAPLGVSVGQEISYDATQPSVGNSFKLKDLPEGTLIHNIELRPGDGGKFARASGTAARIVSKQEGTVAVMLPSKKRKFLNENCIATVGTVAAGGRLEKPLLKAGNSFYKYAPRRKLWHKTSAGKMNAVNHPFGNTRSSKKAKARPAPKFAPPGRKVGKIRPKRTGMRK